MAVFTKLDAVAVLKKSTHRSRQALGTQIINQDNYKRDKERCQMITVDEKTRKITVEGAVEALLRELAMITSEIEEVIGTSAGVDVAEKLVDDAIKIGRAYNRIYVFNKQEEK